MVTTHVRGLLAGRGKVKTCLGTMDSRSPLTLAEQVAAAHDWWRDAGVDSQFDDDPRNWLERPAKPVEEALPPAGPVKAAPSCRSSAWRSRIGLAADPPRLRSVVAGQRRARHRRHGAEDRPPRYGRGRADGSRAHARRDRPRPPVVRSTRQAHRATCSPRWACAEDAAYIASALPRHAHHPDWAALAARDLGKVLAHHVNLVAPKRLLVLGRAMLPLFGHDPAQAGAKPRPIALESCAVPALVSFGPDALLQTPRFRAGLMAGVAGLDGRRPVRIVRAAVLAAMLLSSVATHAQSSREYFVARAARTATPRQLSDADRVFYTALCSRRSTRATGRPSRRCWRSAATAC